MTVTEVRKEVRLSPAITRVLNSPTSSDESSPSTPCDVMSPVNKEFIKLHGTSHTRAPNKRNGFISDEIDYTVKLEMNAETDSPLLRRLKKQGSIGALLLPTQSLATEIIKDETKRKSFSDVSRESKD
jgi:hypothetical protein